MRKHPQYHAVVKGTHRRLSIAFWKICLPDGLKNRDRYRSIRPDEVWPLLRREKNRGKNSKKSSSPPKWPKTAEKSRKNAKKMAKCPRNHLNRSGSAAVRVCKPNILVRDPRVLSHPTVPPRINPEAHYFVQGGSKFPPIAQKSRFFENFSKTIKMFTSVRLKTKV